MFFFQRAKKKTHEISNLDDSKGSYTFAEGKGEASRVLWEEAESFEGESHTSKDKETRMTEMYLGLKYVGWIIGILDFISVRRERDKAENILKDYF